MPTLGTNIIKNFKSKDSFNRKLSQWMLRLGILAIFIYVLALVANVSKYGVYWFE